MKKLALIILILMVFVLTACVNADVFYGLSEDNTVNQQYSLTIESTKVEARNYAEQIKKYWDSLGIDAKTKRGVENVSVNGSKSTVFEQKRTAAAAFADVITANESMLSDVVFEYTPSFEKDSYSLNGTVSLEDILRQSELQDIPENDIEELTGSAEQGEYTLSIKLPGQIEQTNADETKSGTCTWNLHYEQEKNILLTTTLNNVSDINEYEQIGEKFNAQSMLLRLLIAAGGFILLLIIVLIIVRAVRKRRY